jgi:hypothetical protein
VIIFPQDMRREDRLSGGGVFPHFAAPKAISERFGASRREIVLAFDE